MPAIPKSFGHSVQRKEDLRFITGRGRYTDDVNLRGQTWAAFVRSPLAHAEITGFDVAAAVAMPGVLAVYTGEDFARSGLGHLQCGFLIHSSDGSPMNVGDHPALADRFVRYVGDAVAIVIAEDKLTAKLAAEQVLVDYEELPVVVDVVAAGEPDAPQLHPAATSNLVYDWETGDAAAVKEAFLQAAHVTTLDLVNNRLVPNAMEPRAVNAQYDPGRDQHTVYIASQNPHGLRTTLAAIIGFGPEHKIRVISEDVGGGFGSKAFNYAEEVACLWASKQLHRPVKWAAERGEAFLTDAHGRDHVATASIALDADHRILGLRVFTQANIGAYLSTFGSLIPTHVYAPLLSGQYDIQAIHARVVTRYTNTTPVDAYRGAGRPEAGYVVERLLDVAAKEVGIAPATMRRINFIRQFPHQTPVDMTYDIGDFDAHLDKALAMIDAEGFVERRAAAETRGKKRGLGIGCYIEAAGIGPSSRMGRLGSGAGLWESAEVRVNPTGSVEVLTGSHSHGQGHETTFAQWVADQLGVDFADVEIVHGDTDKVQYGVGTFGSRSGPLGLSAISLACGKVIEKGKLVAAQVLDVAADTIEFADGEFSSPDSNQHLSFTEMAFNAYTAHQFTGAQLEPGLTATCFFDPPDFNFPAGTHICEVEVDPETGTIEIVDFVAVDDFGVVGNPMIVEGQVHGGVVQGIGQALLENVRYDDYGQLMSGSFMDYAMPRADDAPDVRVGFTETRSTTNPLGMKGCGEAGAIGSPPALVNAVTDALEIRSIDMPLTPERVWRAMLQK